MKCNTCNTEYTPMPGLEEYDQADGCSATVYLKGGHYYLLAHYGSRFDMQLYTLNGGMYDVGVICDNCINNLINEGMAHLIEDGVW